MTFDERHPAPTARMIAYCALHDITISDDPDRIRAGYYFIAADGKSLSYVQVMRAAEQNDQQADYGIGQS